jgi:hypothetical protein
MPVFGDLQLTIWHPCSRHPYFYALCHHILLFLYLDPKLKPFLSSLPMHFGRKWIQLLLLLFYPGYLAFISPLCDFAAQKLVLFVLRVWLMHRLWFLFPGGRRDSANYTHGQMRGCVLFANGKCGLYNSPTT